MEKIEFVINEDNKIMADSVFQLLGLIEEFRSWFYYSTELNPAYNIEVRQTCHEVFFDLIYRGRCTVTFSIEKGQQDNTIKVSLECDEYAYNKVGVKELFDRIMKYFGICAKINKGDIVLVKRKTNSTKTAIIGKYYKVESVEKNFINLYVYGRCNEEHFVAVNYSDVEKVNVKTGDFVLGKEIGICKWKLDVFDGVDGHGHVVTKANNFYEIIPYKDNEDKLGQQ